MTDYERTTVSETGVSDPTVPVPGTVVQPTSMGSRTVVRDHAVVRNSGWSQARRVIVLIFGILQALLVLRIILLLLVANPGNDIVSGILGITDVFVEPFRGVFSLNRVTADSGSVLDVAAIVALIGWTLVEALVLAAMRLFDRTPASA
ncbi:MAG: YggT family protein [Candidatus Limnocylindrales bacterium]